MTKRKSIARMTANARKRYTSSHWGREPGRVIDIPDNDIPEHLVQMGELLELRVDDPNGPAFDLKFDKARPPCHLAFAMSKDERLYNILTPSMLRSTRKLWRPGEPAYLLSELAAYAPGRQNQWTYPPVRVQCLGTITHVLYFTDKLEDEESRGQGGEATYIHELGEESGKRPLLGVSHDGRLWWAGGDYRVLDDGIVN